MRRAAQHTQMDSGRPAWARSVVATLAGLGLAFGLISCSDLKDHPAGTVSAISSPEQYACGKSCHALPPTTGNHPAVSDTSCAQCHGQVVSLENGTVVISHPALHGNGVKEVSCTGCHGMPPTADNHPAGSATGCVGCHGEVVSLVNGSIVVTNAALHRDGKSEYSCTGCHGMPPTANNHPVVGATSCAGCHDQVVSLVDGSIAIRNSSLHRDGKSEYSCTGCHGMPPTSAGHPAVAANSCASCHGQVVNSELQIIDATLHRNGRADVTSMHPEGWLNPSAATFHGAAIAAAAWDMSSCRSCHGSDYAGGQTGTSCLTCHPATPEGCTTCHGSSDNAAPPKDTRRRTDTAYPGVGAHQAHVQEGSVGRALACSECHQVPGSVAAPGHLDGDGQAELNFGTAARAGGANPVYDPATATCSGSYCHSGGRFGQGGPVVWTAVGVGAGACGTCHGIPPAPSTGHMATNLSCSICHGSVVDARLQIINRDLHMNGQVDF